MDVVEVRVIRNALIGAGLAVALVFSSCGGESSSGGGDGTDKGFVKEVCSAVNRFRDDATQQIISNPGSLGDEEKLSQVMAKPFARFVETFAEAKPPADLASWHDDATEDLERVLKEVNAGKGGGEIFQDSTLFIEPSAEQQERLLAAADGVSECDGATVIFGGLD